MPRDGAPGEMGESHGKYCVLSQESLTENLCPSKMNSYCICLEVFFPKFLYACTKRKSLKNYFCKKLLEKKK